MRVQTTILAVFLASAPLALSVRVVKTRRANEIREDVESAERAEDVELVELEDFASLAVDEEGWEESADDAVAVELEMEDHESLADDEEGVNASASFRTLRRGWRQWTPTQYEFGFRTEVLKHRRNGISCPSGKKYPRNTNDLVWDCDLFRIARNWSMHMDETKVPLAHNQGGSTFTQRMNEAGYSQAVRLLAWENIASGGPHVHDKIAGRFLRSTTGHCENMGRPNAYRIGVGYSGTTRKVTTLVVGMAKPNPDRSCCPGGRCPSR